MTISDAIKNNVRAVLLSKTDGKGVLVSTFLRDYKSIIGETLMYRNMGYDSLESFIKEVPDVCRLEYAEKEMAYKLYGIAKPNTYASSFMKRAEGGQDGSDDRDDRQRRRNRGGNSGGGKGDKIVLGSNLDEDWLPNGRGHYSVCFPNKRGTGMETKEDVAIAFAAIGEVAEINMISQLTFVRYTDEATAKKAIQVYGSSLGLRRADERQCGGNKKDRRDSRPAGGSQGGRQQDRFKSSSHNDEEWDNDKNDKDSKLPAWAGKQQNGFKGSQKDDKDDNRDAQPPAWGRKPQNGFKGSQGSHNDDDWEDEPAPVKKDYKNLQQQQQPQHSNDKKNDGLLASPKDNTEKIQVYVGNLPSEIQQIELVDLLRPYINIGVRLKHTGNTNKVYAFVDFTDASMAMRMIEDLNETTMKGRTLKIRFAGQHPAISKEGSASTSKEESHPHTGSIEKQFEQLAVHRGNEFKSRQHSPMENLSRTVQNDYATKGSAPGRSPNKKDTMLSPAASYHSSGSRSSSVQMPALENLDSRNGFDDMPCLEEIHPSGRDHRRLKGHSPRAQRVVNMDMDMPPLEKTQLLLSPEMPRLEKTSPFERLGSQNFTGPPPQLDQGTVQLFLGNFPYGTKEEDLLFLLAPFGVIGLTMMNQEVKNRSTYAFATCCDMLHAEKAIAACDQSFYRGRKLTVTLANPAAASQMPSASSSNSSLNLAGAPFANLTCTVGGDAGRQVHMEDSNFNHAVGQPEHQGRDQRYYDRNANAPGSYNDGPPRQKYGEAGLAVKSDFNYRRLTNLLRDNSMIVSKLRGEDRFMQRPGTMVAVLITHVENDKHFWGQLIKDSINGQNQDLQVLVTITQMLQDDSCKHLQVKNLGRCTAMFNGEWFRAWCMHISHKQGQEYCDLLYVDYGNTEQVPKSECYLTNTKSDVWTLPPMARPFKLPEPQYQLDKFLNKVVVFEIAEPGSSSNNFVTTVVGNFDE